MTKKVNTFCELTADQKERIFKELREGDYYFSPFEAYLTTPTIQTAFRENHPKKKTSD
jgi:hypothetical protein